MFNKFFPNLCVKVNKLWAKLTRNDEVIDVMEEGSVKVNPTLAGTEALITGIEVEGTKYKNVAVEANPTLAGTEADLTGLEVNGTKYAIPSGTQTYEHHIKVIYSHASSGAGDPAKSARLYFTVESTSSTEITTLSDLMSIMTNFNYLHEIMCTGSYNGGGESYYNPIISCNYIKYGETECLNIATVYFSTTGSSVQSFLLNDTSAYTIVDVVK